MKRKQWNKRNPYIYFVLILSLVITSVISINMIVAISSYGKLINYVGIVRGASQRVVKLETNHLSENQLLDYVDDVLNELITGEGHYGLRKIPSKEYNDNLEKLSKQWDKVKGDIQSVRSGDDGNDLLTDSEALFEIANTTVFSIEKYAHEQSSLLTTMIVITTSIGVTIMALYIANLLSLKKENRILEDRAGKDPLTGAFNLDKFKETAARLLDENPEKKFAVLFIDFQDFKYINDIFGYSYGDMLLQKYAKLMKESLTDFEAFGRNAADQFIAIRHYEEKETLLKRQLQVEKEFIDSILRSNRHMITIATGFCCTEDVIEELDIDAFLNRANFAQKTIKNNPSVHYAFYNDSIRIKRIEELTIKDRMQEALINNEFVVYMQPKVDLESEKIAGAEALVRWQTQDQGLLSPGVFIPVLEKNHFLNLLDEYVFEQVCRWLRGRLDQNLPVVPVSVNVSKTQFYFPNFVQIYKDIRDKFKIPNNLIEIEFTESYSFENSSFMAQIVTDLHNNGFPCSLDDFGLGFSSLGMLKELPIDTLKLDASFFKQSGQLNKEQTIIKSIIAMNKELGIHTVAEGVELEEQVAFLKSIHCELVQGFAFYRPMPIDAFEKLLN